MQKKKYLSALISVFSKNKVARKITGNLGKTKIQDDKIICYVNNSSLKNKKSKYIGFLSADCNKALAQEYNLDKPIHYIVDNAHFDEGLYFQTGKNTQVTFRNCTFGSYVNFYACLGEVIFENNEYYSTPKTSIGEPFFKGQATTLKFQDECFGNYTDGANAKAFGMMVDAKTLIIKNSFFIINDGSIEIKAEDVQLIESVIDCPRVSIEAEDISTDESSIYAEENIIIENKKQNEIEEIESGEILYNGQEFSCQNGGISIITKETIKLIKARIELLQKLKCILNSQITNTLGEISNNKIFKKQ